MSPSPYRVAFAGLAHSHPYTDAANVRALGGEVVGVWDADAAAAATFAVEFGGVAVPTPSALEVLGADLVIATPRTPDAAALLVGLGGTAPVFVNKVIAATPEQFAEIDGIAPAAPFGTSSVLRFAPAAARVQEEIGDAEIVSIRIHAQHDGAGFRLAGREWQDDPARGGGILVTVGMHAWEMLDVVLPGARLASGTGWTRRAVGSSSRSEDAAGLDGVVVDAEGRSTPVQVTVTGVPGPDRYAIEVATADGIRSMVLDSRDPDTDFGFRGLMEALRGARGTVVAPWAQARTVVENTIRAARVARGGERSGGPGD